MKTTITHTVAVAIQQFTRFNPTFLVDYSRLSRFDKFEVRLKLHAVLPFQVKDTTLARLVRREAASAVQLRSVRLLAEMDELNRQGDELAKNRVV